MHAPNYVYPSNDLNSMSGSSHANINIYGQLGYGPAYVKYSHAFAHALGFTDSKDSGYIDVGANIAVESGLVLNLHADHQTIKNHPAFSYSDWKVGVTQNFSHGISASLAAYGTNTESDKELAPEMKNLGKSGVALSITKMFM